MMDVETELDVNQDPKSTPNSSDAASKASEGQDYVVPPIKDRPNIFKKGNLGEAKAGRGKIDSSTRDSLLYQQEDEDSSINLSEWANPKIQVNHEGS